MKDDFRKGLLQADLNDFRGKDVDYMGRFFNGMLVGAGIALLVAPMRGDEMRQYLRERWENISGSESVNVQINELKQKAAPKAKQSTENISGSVKQSAKQGEQKADSSRAARQTQLDETAEAPFPSAYPSYVNPETSPNT
jgi:gas vesicle protein